MASTITGTSTNWTITSPAGQLAGAAKNKANAYLTDDGTVVIQLENGVIWAGDIMTLAGLVGATPALRFADLLNNYLTGLSASPAPAYFWVGGSGGSVVIPAVPGSKFPFNTAKGSSGTGLTWNTTTYQTNEDVSGMGLNINISIVATPATIPGDVVLIRIRTNLGVLTGRFFDTNAFGNFTLTWNGVMPAGSGPMWIDVYTTLDGTYAPGSTGTYLQVQRIF